MRGLLLYTMLLLSQVVQSSLVHRSTRSTTHPRHEYYQSRFKYKYYGRGIEIFRACCGTLPDSEFWSPNIKMELFLNILDIILPTRCPGGNAVHLKELANAHEYKQFLLHNFWTSSRKREIMEANAEVAVRLVDALKKNLLGHERELEFPCRYSEDAPILVICKEAAYKVHLKRLYDTIELMLKQVNHHSVLFLELYGREFMAVLLRLFNSPDTDERTMLERLIIIMAHRLLKERDFINSGVFDRILLDLLELLQKKIRGTALNESSPSLRSLPQLLHLAQSLMKLSYPVFKKISVTSVAPLIGSNSYYLLVAPYNEAIISMLASSKGADDDVAFWEMLSSGVISAAFPETSFWNERNGLCRIRLALKLYDFKLITPRLYQKLFSKLFHSIRMANEEDIRIFCYLLATDAFQSTFQDESTHFDSIRRRLRVLKHLLGYIFKWYLDSDYHIERILKKLVESWIRIPDLRQVLQGDDNLQQLARKVVLKLRADDSLTSAMSRLSVRDTSVIG